MSRVGHGIDHCPVEGVWGIVKTAMYSRNKFSSGDEVRSAIEQYIPFLQLRTFSGTIWSKDANGSLHGRSAREEPGTVPDYQEQTFSEIQSEICGITKCRKSHVDTQTPTWNLRL